VIGILIFLVFAMFNGNYRNAVTGTLTAERVQAVGEEIHKDRVVNMIPLGRRAGINLNLHKAEINKLQRINKYQYSREIFKLSHSQ
jgi:ribosomal protein S25